jgi:hypothetical protein
MANDAILRIKILTDASQAALGLEKTSAAGGKFGSAMRKAALPAAAAGAAVLAFGKKAVDAASKLQQSKGATEAVFGEQAKAVQRAADAAAKTMGLSAADYNQYASLVGTALQNAGMSVEDSVKASNDVMQRGADLSALYGGTTADAVEAINAAVARSEFDPLEKYGVSLNMTAINAELAAKGQDKLTGAALETAKKQAILEAVFKKSAKAQGQYAREADTAAGQQQSMSAAMENTAASLGTILLPMVAALSGKLAELAKWAQKNTTVVQILAGAILSISVAVLAVNAALKVYQASVIVFTAVSKAATAASLGTRLGLAALAVQEYATAVATRVLGAAQRALPILAIIGLIILLVGAIILLWKRSETFRKITLAVWKAVRAAATAAWNAIKSVGLAAFRALSTYVRSYLAVARAVFNAVRAVASAVWNAIAAGARQLGSVVRNAWAGIRTAATNTTSAIRDAWGRVRDVVNGVADKIKSALGAAFAAVKRAAAGAGSALASPFNTLKNAVDGVIGAVRSLIGWLGKIHVPKISLPKIPGVRSAPSPSSATSSPTVRGLSAAPTALAASSTGSGVTIVVQGALDPESVARQIRRLLSSHGQRVGTRNRPGTLVF